MEITIRHELLEEAGKKNSWNFLKVFIDSYRKNEEGEDPTQKDIGQLNGWQNTLLAFGYFHDEVRSGGFVQLVHNGYGGYIFDNPFAKVLRMMGAHEMSKLVYKAKTIYDVRKEEMEQEVDEDELAETYEKFEEFDLLDDKYIELEDNTINIIAQYVDNHVEDFAKII